MVVVAVADLVVLVVVAAIEDVVVVVDRVVVSVLFLN